MKKESFYTGLDKIMREYNGAGLTITEIRCNGAFKSIMNDVKDDMDIEMDYTTPGDHQPEAERNIRVITKRIRVAYHRLPFEKMPRVMWKYLAMTATDQLNYFPVKGGVSVHYSPHQLIKKRNISFKQECILPFGT